MKYKLIRTKRKTLAITINENCEIIVKSPKKCSLNFIETFIFTKLEWIKKQQQIIFDQNEKNKDFLSLKKILILGQEYQIIDKENHYKIGPYYVKHSKTAQKQAKVGRWSIKKERTLPKVGMHVPSSSLKCRF